MLTQRAPGLQRTRSSRCVWCGSPADSYCSRCAVTPYCSSRCQTRDWVDRHRAVCHNLARLANEIELRSPVIPALPEIQNPAPLRRPRQMMLEDRPGPSKRDDDTATRVSDKSNRSDHFNRLQERGRAGPPRNQYVKKDRTFTPSDNKNQNTQRNQSQYTNKNYNHSYNRHHEPQPATPEPEAKTPDTKPELKEDWPQRKTAPAVAANMSKIALAIEPEKKPNTPEPEAKTFEVKPDVKKEFPDKKTATANVAKKSEIALSNEPQMKPTKTEPKAKTLETKTEVKKDIPQKKSATANVAKTPQQNGTAKPQAAVVAAKPATVGDVTPIRKLVPKNYIIELLTVGDTVLLSVDAKASDCRSTGDYVCLSMHEKFEADYQKICEDYTLDCDADNEAFKPSPGDACSYFNVEDGSWYRARCLNSTTMALIDGSKLVTVTPTDKIRKLSAKYETMPEFCCVLQNSTVEVGANLKCVLVSKVGDGYKVTLENVETNASAGDGVVTRWTPTVDYASAQPVIPEVPRPPLKNNSRVLLVDATSLDRAFVRPADADSQRAFDDILENVLLAGRKASPLTEAPQRGQTLIARYTDGVHYRALCRRTSRAQNKYLLEYVEFGNEEVCRDLSNLFPCPAELDLTSVPPQVSMVKLAPEGGVLTPPAIEYIDKLKDSTDEMILTLPNGASSAPSGSEVTLKLVKTGDVVNRKVIEMCTPEWKKLEEKGGDVVEVAPLMFWDLEYSTIPSGPVDLEILDVSVLEGGLVSGCVSGDPHMDYVFNQLTQKMAEYCNSELGREPYLPKTEELCIAQCPPYPQWFRAVLLEQVSGAGGDEARVCYVDYGNIQVVPVSLLRKMLPEFVRNVPVLVSHIEIKDFPKEPTREMLLRAVQHLQLDDEGRGKLHVEKCEKQEQGMYVVTAPALLRDMLDH